MRIGSAPLVERTVRRFDNDLGLDLGCEVLVDLVLHRSWDEDVDIEGKELFVGDLGGTGGHPCSP